MSRKVLAGAMALVAAVTGLGATQPGALAAPTVAGGPARSYIVVLKPGAVATSAAATASQRYGLTVSAVYSHALQGYAATVPADQLAALKADPAVAYVEPDQAVRQPTGRLTPLAGALTGEGPPQVDPASCLQTNEAQPNPVRLQLCMAGLSMLAIRGVQPGVRPLKAPAASGPPRGQASPLCAGTPGDDRCEEWVARFNHSKINTFEFPTGLAVSPTGDRVFLGGVSWDAEHGSQTMAILGYDARTGRRDWATLPFLDVGCFGCAATGIAVSPDGTQVYVTGYTQAPGTSADIRTLALDAATGAVLWDTRYDRNIDLGEGIALSPNGRWVYVTAFTFDPADPRGLAQSLLVRYDAQTGREQWSHLSRLGEIYTKIRAAGERIYTTGAALNSAGTHFGSVTVATSGRSGAQLWRTTYDGGGGAYGYDQGLDLVVSAAGDRVFMTGLSVTGINEYSWLTVGYVAGSGRQIWAERYADQPGVNVARAVAISPAGDRVFAVGYTAGRQGYAEPAAVAYDTATGQTLWTQTYASPHEATGGITWDAVVSPDGSRLFLTGQASNAVGGTDDFTLALDAANGADHWVARYSSAYRSSACLSRDQGLHIAMSPDGQRLYSAGDFQAPPGDLNHFDFATLAYDPAGGIENPPNGRIPPPPSAECPQLLPPGVDKIDADVSSTQAGNGSGTVTGVNVYVIDDYLDSTNPELNVVSKLNFTGGPYRDCNEFGTAVAGVIGARDNAARVVGVAPGVALTSVKVIGCSGVGSLSDVLSGVDWVTAHAAKPAVANMSLQFAPSRALDDAVTASADSGIFYALAAGNGYFNSCEEVSPGRIGTHPGVMAVGSIDQNGAESDFSDSGPCVSIWAPGELVLTTRPGGGDAIGFGTEFASAHVAGTAALYLSQHPQTSPPRMKRILLRDGVLTGFTSADGSPVLQVYAGRY